MEKMEKTEKINELANQLTLKQVVDLAGKIIVKKINERNLEILEFEQSKVEGCVHVKFTIDETIFSASFFKDGIIAWHTWQGIEKPELSKQETKDICDYVWSKWNAMRKDIILKEIEEKKKELENLY